MKRPTRKAVRQHFATAKTVECIANKMNIDVTGITSFEFDKEARIWTSVGGAITFWKKGVFATIVNSVSPKTKS